MEIEAASCKTFDERLWMIGDAGESQRFYRLQERKDKSLGEREAIVVPGTPRRRLLEGRETEGGGGR